MSSGVKELEQLKNPNSLILLLDKCRTPEGLRQIRELNDDFWKAVVEIAKRNGLFDLLKEVVYIIMKNYHASDEVIRETMEKLNKGQVKEGMLIYSEGLDVLKAEEKGERKKAIDASKKMIKDGLSLELISKYEGLSIHELEQIKEMMQNENE